MKSAIELLTGKKSKWAVVDEKGNILEEFRLNTTANQWLSKMKLNKQEKLKVVEIRK